MAIGNAYAIAALVHWCLLAWMVVLIGPMVADFLQCLLVSSEDCAFGFFVHVRVAFLSSIMIRSSSAIGIGTRAAPLEYRPAVTCDMPSAGAAL